MSIKHAADLERGDVVLIADDDRRVVETVTWTGTFVSSGVQAVRVWWAGRDEPSLLSAVDVLPVEERA